MSENPGCLGAILRLFGIGPATPAQTGPLPYRLRDDFLSPSELSFYRVLASAVGDRALVCPKVNLADLFFVVKPNENQAYRNKIDRKHVDFLLCDPQSLCPLVGVELDDKSHQREDRQARDEFVNQVFAAAGLPLLHVPAQAGYSATALAASLSPYMSIETTPVSVRPEPTIGTAPICPKCGVAMVVRTANRGDKRGQAFYGCTNYPKCRETAQISSNAS
ncbi:MAG: DUF2726 domain-containing protein [Coriobacteriia bacterium]|nr:DUF2726 domain-containing protein [Coriobacteriia bacterium]